MSLTLHEQKMLDRLTKAGVLHWTSIRADDTRTLNRLVKKGAAFETVGRAGRRAWAPTSAAPDAEPSAPPTSDAAISADAAPGGGGNEAS